jgi:hypothetical protein
MRTLSKQPCPFITFYSFSGGVGRSTAVFNVANNIASRGFRVLIVDMDLDAPDISYLLGDRNQPGFVDLLLDVIGRGEAADLFRLPAHKVLARYCAPYELPLEFQSVGASLHIMPAGCLNGAYVDRLERLDLSSRYRDGDGLALVKAFKQVVQESDEFDYVLIDSNNGFSYESGICTRDLADGLMIVSGLNKQNIDGTAHFLAALRDASPDPKLLQMILCHVPNGEDRERQAQAIWEAAWEGPLKTNLRTPEHPHAFMEGPHIRYLGEAYKQIGQHVMDMFGKMSPDV